LYTGDPRLDPTATLISQVRDVNAGLERLAGGSTSGVGRGGMRSKVAAAKIATRMGAHTVVALGKHPQVISRILQGEEVGTMFVAKTHERLGARKQWLGFAAAPRGALLVDDGAARALTACGSSLLPVGVTDVTGAFKAGDVVSVLDADGHEIAHGLVNYTAEEMRQIAGQRTDQIEEILGYHPYDEAIHRDNLLLF
jgi:glutamate 5-kinase